MSPIQLLNKMQELFPDAKSELVNWSTPFQFLICIVLSAQTTDKGVNQVTKPLFTKYPTPELLSVAQVGDVEKIIRSVNYFRTKSRHIIQISKILLEDFKCVVPKKEDDLIKLPGVGRKTANVFLNDMYRLNNGIGVDTHIARVSKRFGLTVNTDPNLIAKDLESLFPKKDWWRVNTLFVLYGRYYCKANMKSSKCIFKGVCSYCTKLPDNI